MAFSDYHPCDNCGDKKTFYDANMNYECNDDGSITYDGGLKLWCLCRACSLTHEIVIVEKGPTHED